MILQLSPVKSIELPYIITLFPDKVNFRVMIWNYRVMIRGTKQKNSHDLLKTIRTSKNTIKYIINTGRLVHVFTISSPVLSLTKIFFGLIHVMISPKTCNTILISYQEDNGRYQMVIAYPVLYSVLISQHCVFIKNFPS